MVKLLELKVEVAKERLTSVDLDDVRPVQGEIRGLRALIRAITEGDKT